MLRLPIRVSAFDVRMNMGLDVAFIGIYYESGKEPPAEGPPKLHLLIESNEEFRVRRECHNF